MKNLSVKLRRIYFPAVLMSVAFLIAYSFLNWLLIIQLHLFEPKEDLIEFWLPFVLPWIPALIWLRPRVKLLEGRRGRDPIFAVLFVITLVAAVPTILAQRYIATATGKLTALPNLEQINTAPATKYYSLKDAASDRTRMGVKMIFSVSGKRNQDLNMKLYVGAPLYPTSLHADTINSFPQQTIDTNSVKTNEANTPLQQRPPVVKLLPAPPAAVCIKYQKQISNKLSDAEKEASAEKFYNESLVDFNGKNLDGAIYYERIGNSDDRDGYLQALEYAPGFDHSGTPVLLVPSFTPFTQRNGNALPWTFFSFLIGAFVLFLLLSFLKLKESQTVELESVDEKASMKEELSFLIPRKGFMACPIIVYINVAIFLLVAFSEKSFLNFDGASLLNWGANFRPYTTDGQWWRLLTAAFLHGGIMHLLLNMYGLFFVGVFLEPFLGTKKFVLFYIITAIVSSLASIGWYPATVSVGASGAIFGMYGIFLALLTTKHFSGELKKVMLINTSVFISVSLLAGIGGGIDNAAHIGGLLSGLLIGYIVALTKKQQEGFLDPEPTQD